jgi:hypothetical protein
VPKHQDGSARGCSHFAIGIERRLAGTVDRRECRRSRRYSRAKLLSKQREAVAFAAHTGDKQAKLKLADINAEDASLAGNLASVEAALTVARANVAAAKVAEAQTADHEKARQVAALNAKLKEQLDDANDAFADAIESVLSARALLQEMTVLGVVSPTDQLFRINSVAAMKTVIQKLPSSWINDFEFSRLAPPQKKQFRDLANSWCNQIANLVAQRLPQPKKTEAA